MTERENDILVETGGKRLTRGERRELKRQAMLRYRKHLRINRLAEPGVHEIVLVLYNLKAGFNVAKIFRSAEALGAHEIQLVDIGPFDPAPAKGGFKKVPARSFDDFSDCYRNLNKRGYRVFTLEPETSCGNLAETPLPRRSAFVIGHEEFGISFNRADFPGIECLNIPHFGSTQSLNVSVAASIVLYEYVRQHRFGHRPATDR
jgi:tRNA G18 (ribose-2'-O)-methylase SpoU